MGCLLSRGGALDAERAPVAARVVGARHLAARPDEDGARVPGQLAPRKGRETRECMQYLQTDQNTRLWFSTIFLDCCDS